MTVTVDSLWSHHFCSIIPASIAISTGYDFASMHLTDTRANTTTSLQIFASYAQFQIEEFEGIAAEFARSILDMAPEECFLSNESELDDFFRLGESLDTGARSWDKFVIAKIFELYGIELSATHVNLVRLFSMIGGSRDMSFSEPIVVAI